MYQGFKRNQKIWTLSLLALIFLIFLGWGRIHRVGADIVEYNPTRDLHGQTSVVCCKFLKEISSAILRGCEVAPSVWP